MTTTADDQGVRTLLELLTSGGPQRNGEAIGALLDDDVSYQFHVPTAETAHGREKVLEELLRQTSHYTDLSFEIHSVTSGADRVVVERQDSFALAHDGVAVSYPVAAVFDIGGTGRISAWREYWDKETLTAQVRGGQ
jgi:limonene-1,2-epoxide hydrolase